MTAKPEPPGIAATYKATYVQGELEKARLHAIEIMFEKGMCFQEMRKALEMLGLVEGAVVDEQVG